MFAGHGFSGKSSLLHVLNRIAHLNLAERVLSPNFKLEVQKLESTRGASPSTFDPSAKDVEFVVFDLAGQQEYAVSHRHFLSGDHTLYVVCFTVTSSLQQQFSEIKFWLEYLSMNIKESAGSIPVILVATKIDSREHEDLASMLNHISHRFVGRHGKLQICDVVATSAYENTYVGRHVNSHPFTGKMFLVKHTLDGLRKIITDVGLKTAAKVSSALCALRSALCALRSALCALRSALCALRSALCALCSALCALCAVLCGLCAVRLCVRVIFILQREPKFYNAVFHVVKTHMQDRVFYSVEEFKSKFQSTSVSSIVRIDRLEGALSFLHCVGAVVLANGIVCVKPALLADLVQPFTASAEHCMQDFQEDLFMRFGVLSKAQILQVVRNKIQRYVKTRGAFHSWR
jgi:GTPase SAR1 family protein